VADLAVQFRPNILVVNMKTAREIELNCPEWFLLQADEVIE
jgi:hypothetical protein